MCRTLILLLLIPTFCLANKEVEELIPIPDPPEMPMPVEDSEEMEADITIIRRKDKTIQEFRKNGQLYKVKIIPDIGPAYYFIDTNGDGNMDVRRDDLDPHLNINQWKILEWD